MKKKLLGLTLAVAGCLLIWSPDARAEEAQVPSYVELPKKGEYTMGEERDAELGTDFYLYIEKPSGDKDEDEDAPITGTIVTDPSSMLPRTGDYGPDAELLLWISLLLGSGYLLCGHYAKRD
ncbi:MAG: hypothetical protein KH452_09755 [Clostridiales bacterium]|nr:hypothetical protein [Clostridiales bacterium]